MTHTCVGNLAIIGSDNGLMPGRCQAIIWTNDEILLIGPLGTNFSEILIEIYTFSFKKMHLKMPSAKWRLFRLGLNVLNICYSTCAGKDPFSLIKTLLIYLGCYCHFKLNYILGTTITGKNCGLFQYKDHPSRYWDRHFHFQYKIIARLFHLHDENTYRQTFNIRCTKYQSLNVSLPILQLVVFA